MVKSLIENGILPISEISTTLNGEIFTGEQQSIISDKHKANILTTYTGNEGNYQ